MIHAVGHLDSYSLLLLLICSLFDSGDTDAVVPVTATRYSIDALKLPTLVNWHPWYDNGKVSSFLLNRTGTHTGHTICVPPSNVSKS